MAARERGNPEIARTFKRYGGVAEKKTDLFHALRALEQKQGKEDTGAHEPGGHPDYTVLLPPFGFYVEAKAGSENYFNLAEIAPKQREWLGRFAQISFLWLWMGDGRPNAKANPRHTWLIPWPHWLKVEDVLRSHGLRGLSYSQPHKVEHRTKGLSAIQLLAPYELTWAGDRAWDIPKQHPIWNYLLELTETFVPQCELSSTVEANGGQLPRVV
jgi:hypothetical protein